MKFPSSDRDYIIVFTLAMVIAIAAGLIKLAAVDWDWRCLFAECRIDK